MRVIVGVTRKSEREAYDGGVERVDVSSRRPRSYCEEESDEEEGGEEGGGGDEADDDGGVRLVGCQEEGISRPGVRKK